MDIIEHFARGWYWCGECGFDKPEDYKYIEIAKVNSGAIVCLDSACFLNGIIQQEPDIIQIATARSNRKKIDMQFPIKRHYFSTMPMDSVLIKTSPYGDYYYFNQEKSLEDCVRLKDKVEPENYMLIERICKDKKQDIKRLQTYIRHLNNS